MKSAWFKHLTLVCKHKKYVYLACKEAGIPWQGVIHDLSKFSPTEFLESAHWYSGDRSPIDNCKDALGYSLAWFHHRGRNKHHWEYWVDDFQDGMVPKLMPFKYALEMLCDFIGAGKAYMGEKFTYKGEWEWWQNKKKMVIMHPVVWHFIDHEMEEMAYHGSKYKINYLDCQQSYYHYLLLYESGELPGMYHSTIDVVGSFHQEQK